MLPVIAIVGRPNVGKSTLFNQLTQSRQALVVDLPGVTRDRQYGEGQYLERNFIVIDTGGIEGEDEFQPMLTSHTMTAIHEANVVLFMVDARVGVTPGDLSIAEKIRRANKEVYLVINKIDGIDEAQAAADFAELGIANYFLVAASHKRGVITLIEAVLEKFPETEHEETAKGIKVAIVGKPNAGKSTLINRIIGEERVVVYDMPGTTRDSIYVPFKRDEQDFTLIDTAGVRRRGRVTEVVEKFSVIKTLQAIKDANVIVLVVDARENITDQDLHLLGFIIESGRSFIIAVNKWDGLDSYQKEQVKSEIDRRLGFVDYAKTKFISALHGTGVGNLFSLIMEAYKSAMTEMSTADLTALLERAIHAHSLPYVKGRRIKLRYAHSGGQNPPTVVIHGTQTEATPKSYQRYLENFFREKFKLVGTPIRLIFKSSKNPYASKKK